MSETGAGDERHLRRAGNIDRRYQLPGRVLLIDVVVMDAVVGSERGGEFSERGLLCEGALCELVDGGDLGEEDEVRLIDECHTAEIAVSKLY
jgi:hypothetical protein